MNLLDTPSAHLKPRLSHLKRIVGRLVGWKESCPGSGGVLRRFAGFCAAAVLLVFVAGAGGAAVAASDLEWRIEPVTVVTKRGRFAFMTEIADKPELRRRGLMFREQLGDNRAMLFDFQSTGAVTMWMKNTPLSLDMVFIREDGIVHHVERSTVPFSLDIVSSRGAVRAVLELKAGIAKKVGLKPGDRILHKMFSAK